MTGGAGSDTYIVDNVGDSVIELAGGGLDAVQASVTFALQGELERLTLTGSGAIDGIGNALANAITGNSAANVIDGAAGVDTMTGGAGNDTYIADNTSDKTIEVADGGTDLVQSFASFVLQAEIENLTLLGAVAINGTGNSLANAIVGNMAGNVLDGGAGADTMTGGAGNDTYLVDAGDKTIEVVGGGTDSVRSSISWSLVAEVENLTLTGLATINGTGNSLANAIAGNAAGNVLDGGAGADTMTGGAGNDTYVVDNAGDKTIEVAGGDTDSVQSSISWALAAEVENLTLTGSATINATGNLLANALTGNSANNYLNGAGGADTMSGGAGNDTYIVDNLGDRTIEVAGGGTDSVQSSVSWSLAAEVEKLTLTGSSAINAIGNSLANTLTGNSAINVLNGSTGADTMAGGNGNDTYVVDNAGDETIEFADGGTDSVKSSVSWSLAAEVENLTLTGTSGINGTGNSLANTLTGNSASNVLNGSTGADAMTGDAGNDTYVVDNTGDKTIEVAGGGNDLVESSISFTLQAEVENLTLTGTSTINGTGNALVNTILGNSAANVLNGGAGADSLTGGAGNDTYIIDISGDRVVELANGGHDLVRSSVSCALATEVEDLTLTGTATSATGNTSANVLVGNGSANVIDGKAGADRMTGGAGADIFAFTTALASDLITDFT
ncbi:beta strand repeat-containing protein, partial [Ideonella lacteola]